MKNFFRGVRKHIGKLDAEHLREQYELIAEETASLDKIFETINRGIVVIIADECQFFTAEQIDLLETRLQLIRKLEKKYGFSNMTVKIWFIDQLKGIILGLIINAVLVFAVTFICKNFDNNEALYSGRLFNTSLFSFFSSCG